MTAEKNPESIPSDPAPSQESLSPCSGIPVERLLRLLRGIIGSYGERDFRYQVGEGGFGWYPSLDVEDVATLARVASGEAWGSRDDRLPAPVGVLLAAQRMYDSVYFLHGAVEFLNRAPRQVTAAYGELGMALRGARSHRPCEEGGR